MSTEPHRVSDRYNEDGSPKRSGDQVKPAHNDEPSCQGDFIERVNREMPARMELGLERYGTLLQPFNGRDFMRDVFDELNDLSVYLEGVRREREAMLDLLQDLASWPQKPGRAIAECGELVLSAQTLLASMGQPVTVAMDQPSARALERYGHRREGEDCAPEVCGGSRLDPCIYSPEEIAEFVAAEQAESEAK